MSKNKEGYQITSLYLPLITLNRLVDFHEIWYGGNAIQGDLDAIILIP
jgi:hypothetical protein